MPRVNPETKFKMRVLQDLNSLRNSLDEKPYVLKTQEVAKRGVPDILMCWKGNFIAIELKVDSPLSMLQKYNLDLIDKNSGVAFVATPDNWKKIFQEIKEM